MTCTHNWKPIILKSLSTDRKARKCTKCGRMELIDGDHQESPDADKVS